MNERESECSERSVTRQRDMKQETENEGLRNFKDELLSQD